MNISKTLIRSVIDNMLDEYFENNEFDPDDQLHVVLEDIGCWIHLYFHENYEKEEQIYLQGGCKNPLCVFYEYQ